MITRWLFASFLVAWGTHGFAQTVTVRSGEHESFSRLVFNLPERVDFTLDKMDDRLRLEFVKDGLAFDTSTVFERIPRTRLTGIERLATGSGLDLILDCDCPAQSFWFSDTGLVIDVLNAPDPPVAGPMPDVQGIPRENPVATEAQPAPFPRSLARDLLFDQLDAHLGQGQAQTPTENRELVLSRQQLMLEFGKAASQGLVDPVAPLASAHEKATPEDPGTEDGSPPDETEAARPQAQNMNLRAENVFDQSMRETLRDGLAPVLPPGCLPEEYLDVAAWGSDQPFSTQIGAARTELVDALDQPNPAGNLNMARLYIFFGFGAEARDLIEKMGVPPEHGHLLLALARILEDGQAGQDSPLHRQLECNPRIAIWSALAYSELPESEPLDLDAIMQGFVALPPHLKQHLGPLLARRLLTAGYREESATLQRLLSREDETVTPDKLMVEAAIALIEKETAGAVEKLEDVVAANGDQSADALMRLIDAKVEAREPVSYDMAQLAGAYAFERRKTPEGADLSRAFLSALAASDAFDEAFARLDAMKADYPGREAELTASLYDLLTRNSDDFTFLKHALNRTPQEAGALMPDVALGVAQRLFELGFDRAAKLYFDAAPTLRSSRDYRVLQARIALANGEIAAVEQALSGVEGVQADALRARGLSQTGQHAAAKALFERAKLEEEAFRESLLQQDWSSLSEAEIPGLSEIARTRVMPDAMPPESQPLTRGQAIIEQSGAARQALEQMLERFDLGPEAD